MVSDLDRVRNLIRVVPDFPTKDILFQDITPILNCPLGLQAAINLHKEAIRDLWSLSQGTDADGTMTDVKIDRICGIESRGFLFGMLLAHELGVGFFPARKPGKLPAATLEESYSLEYGSDRIQIHQDAVQPGDRVLLVDDLLATGGTAAAATRLIERAGGTVAGVLVLIELVSLNGRKALGSHRINSVFQV